MLSGGSKGFCGIVYTVQPAGEGQRSAEAWMAGKSNNTSASYRQRLVIVDPTRRKEALMSFLSDTRQLLV